MYHTQQFLNIPVQWFQQMREMAPVYFDEKTQNWNIFRHEDAQRILLDPATFSSQTYILPGKVKLPSLLSMDPPRHRQLRNLIQQAFTPRVVEKLTPYVTDITNELLAAAIARGEMDVVQEFAYPLSLTVIAALLGVPLEDRQLFRYWSSMMIISPQMAPERMAEAASCRQQFYAYFTQKLEERRAQPQDDLLSLLIGAEVDGERLSQEELLEFCVLLLIAGHETTANLIGSTLFFFEEAPDVTKELRMNPAVMGSAIEEIIRCFPPVPVQARVSLADVVIGDQEIKKHQSVTIWIGSANYDPREFPEPERFDIHRSPNRHLSFGYGIHFCVGASLARLEARIALGRILELLPEMRIHPSKQPEIFKSAFTVGIQHYYVVF